ncbi:MAG: hypothetical protein WC120_04740 [Parcubacteria group bacterium]
MICKKCKKEISDDSKFCEFCGNKALENKEFKNRRIWIFVSFVIVLASLFYWYELRPSQSKKQCNESAVKESKDWEQEYDYNYKKCLHNKGL